MHVPTPEQCLQLCQENSTPSNVITHMQAVAQVAAETADKLIEKGVAVNKDLVIAASLLHDIERVKDNHMHVGAELVKEKGYPEVADVMRTHGLYHIQDETVQPKTIEQKIVFYADKCVAKDKIVGVEARFKDLRARYNDDFIEEHAFTKKIEAEINSLLK